MIQQLYCMISKLTDLVKVNLHLTSTRICIKSSLALEYVAIEKHIKDRQHKKVNYLRTFDLQ
jgi:hypothetical protein